LCGRAQRDDPLLAIPASVVVVVVVVRRTFAWTIGRAGIRLWLRSFDARPEDLEPVTFNLISDAGLASVGHVEMLQVDVGHHP